MNEYGANSTHYKSLLDDIPNFTEPDMSKILFEQLQKHISVLDLTDWQKQKLIELQLLTIGDVIKASETKLQEARFIGEIRARQMRNAAIAAVYEYLSS